MFEQGKIDLEEMMECMRTMADKLPKENGQIFEKVFIAFLELITVNSSTFECSMGSEVHNLVKIG